MLDLFSHGRLIAGFPVGTAMDTAYSYSVNPSQLRPKYYEGIDLIMKAWQATEPFSYNGRFNQYRYVNPVPPPGSAPTRRSGSPAAARSRRGTSAPRTTSSTAR